MVAAWCSIAVLVTVWVSWRVDRTPAIDEALGGETEHESLRWTAGTLSSLGSLDSRVVVVAIVLTGLLAARRYADGLYVVVVVFTVHVVERVLKGLEGRWRPVDPEGGYFLPDALRVVVMGGVVVVAMAWWLVRGASVWRLTGVVALVLLLSVFGRLPGTIDVPERADSFPSGHAANTMALAAALLLIRSDVMSRTMTTVVVAAGALSVIAIGWSRVALGYHHPSDVIGGWALALAIAVALDAARRRAVGRRRPPDEPDDGPPPNESDRLLRSG